jgi:hypothetical protein
MAQHSSDDDLIGKEAENANEPSYAGRVISAATKSRFVEILPQVLWFLLAVVAFSVLAPSLLRLLDEGRISKFAVGCLKLT